MNSSALATAAARPKSAKPIALERAVDQWGGRMW